MTTYPNASNTDATPDATPDATRSASGQTTHQERVVSFLLGGRSPEEVLADFRAKQAECQRMKEAGFVLAQDIQRLPCGAISGGMRPVWIPKAQREWQNRWDAMISRLNDKTGG